MIVIVGYLTTLLSRARFEATTQPHRCWIILLILLIIKLMIILGEWIVINSAVCV